MIVGPAVDVVRVIRATQPDFSVLEYDIPTTIPTAPFLPIEHLGSHAIRTR
jgi:hypothetical protein